ncbi:glutamate racemase [Streptobacillus canis]|uniref:glutamate racemase n=1 Tax=Streptobacillus canis TaxID=2678686 RepID=UPI0012E2DA38|nr:glutamate racemase [Streptobacillus canis]
MSIGIFDSGMGGVTVLNQIRKEFPDVEIHFFGDTARLPYGEKTKEQIIQFSSEIVEFLNNKNVELIVVACNTATSLALEELKEKYDINIIGVIEAGVNGALKNNTKNIGLIATTATVNSHKYSGTINELNSNIKVIEKACPLFVPIIENGNISGEKVEKLIEEYVGDLNSDIDTLILGCTHYSILKESIHHKYPNLNIIDPSIEIVNIIKSKKLIKNLHENGKTTFYVSGDKLQFKNNLKRIFDIETDNIFRVKGEE